MECFFSLPKAADSKIMCEYCARPAAAADLAGVKRLYYDAIEFFNLTENTTGWAHGSYPTDQTADSAFSRGELYVLCRGEAVVGSVILNHFQDASYAPLNFAVRESAPEQIWVVHTLAVAPELRRCGAGRALMQYAETLACGAGAVALRLDVTQRNTAGLELYRSCGFNVVGGVVLSDVTDAEKIGKWWVLEKILQRPDIE